VSIRSRAHEYGGGAFRVDQGVLFYVDQADQRWYRSELADQPAAATPLTPDFTDGPTSVRYADGWVTGSAGWLLSVEERVSETSTSHRLVAVATDGSMSVVPLVEQGDFVSAPRPSPDGRRLAWITWDHPSMPWDSSEVHLARLDESPGSIRLVENRRIAGGPGISVGQPRWSRDGSLVFVDDRSGWWAPYRIRADSLDGADPGHAMVDRPAEFHAPDWIFGQATIAELSDGSFACRMAAEDRDQVAHLRPSSSEPTGWSVEVIEQPCVSISGLVSVRVGDGESVCVLGSTPAESQVVFEVPLNGDSPRRVSDPSNLRVETGAISAARPIAVTSGAGSVPGLFFPPVGSETLDGPEGLPPLVVFCHGGPTSSAERGFDPVVQFFTSHGLAVAAPDYRGSSGYGRAYRHALDGRWGEADIDDCVQFALGLVEQGLVDSDRMAIRGTSAGGLTALGALIRSRQFAGAASWYGVTDLEALASDTHDFESRYLDSLVGPWPEAAATYRARSPIHHPEQIVGSVLLLQGDEDRVVPVSQSLRFAERLRECNVPCIQTIFTGESHGFRRADTIEASLVAELEFYRALFGEGGGLSQSE
jgi:dipeptidyl aminopeptidase/acylaminoacyl peptidase